MKYLWHIKKLLPWWKPGKPGIEEPPIWSVNRYRLVERRDRHVGRVRYLAHSGGANQVFLTRELAIAYIQRWIESPEGEECLIWETREEGLDGPGEELGFRDRNRPTIADFDRLAEKVT